MLLEQIPPIEQADSEAERSLATKNSEHFQ